MSHLLVKYTIEEIIQTKIINAFINIVYYTVICYTVIFFKTGKLTSLLDTRFIMILSGRSMVLATASTTNCARVLEGQSNMLYITSCLCVHNRSSWSRHTLNTSNCDVQKKAEYTRQFMSCMQKLQNIPSYSPLSKLIHIITHSNISILSHTPYIYSFCNYSTLQSHAVHTYYLSRKY